MPNRKLNPFEVSINAEEDVRKFLVGFESRDAAKSEKRIRMKALRRLKGEHAGRLRKTLRRCRKERRCLLAICPVCVRRYRIWYTARALRLFLQCGPLLFVTLVDPDDGFSPEKLPGFQPKVLIERVRHRLRRAGVDGVLLGGLDGEFDEDRGKYQPHLHLVCQAIHAAKLRDMGRQHYPSSEVVYRGCVIKPVRYGLGDLQIFYGVKRCGAELVLTHCNRIQQGKNGNLINEGLVVANEGEVSSSAVLTHGNTTGGNLTSQLSDDVLSRHRLNGRPPHKNFFKSMSTASAATRLEREEILRGQGRAGELTEKQQQKLTAQIRKLAMY
jgi:hypothetical protein